MAQTYTVEIFHQGASHTITVSEDETVLSAAHAQGIDLPTSCGAGVCTTCAAKVVSGTVDQPDCMGINKDLQAEGYALLCVAFPRSDLKIETEKEETVYNLQFGQYQNR
ncbi:2Fe-2S iron-sulfur cluster-binding protein [Leptolyngbya sp. AN02str]|uniref:2Fe-2S iron-sulfur cluster-binding protein n=1 Tax=Leptolyngbya sp. AN02str TaxID=3423363 RepID=UPI003D3199DA